MKGTAKSKVVTSGRLTGGIKVQQTRRHTPLMTPKPGPAACPQPAYSLYSTDSRNQVTSLHLGLDRCAALLGGILQTEKIASPSLPRAVKGGTAKSRQSTSLGKKTTKKLPARTDQRSCQSVQCGAGSTTPRTTHQCAAPAEQSEVKLHPPQKQPYNLLQPHSQSLQCLSPTAPPPKPQTCIPPPQSQTSTLPPQTSTLPPQTYIPPPQPDTSIPPSYPTPESGQLPLPQTDCQAASEAPHTPCKGECDGEQEEFVPVRDTDIQSTATDPHITATHSHIHTCIMKMSNMQQEPGKPDKIPPDTHSMDDDSANVKVKTVQYLLGELKALIAGQGSVAERLLNHLEQTVSSLLMNVGSLNIQTEPDLSSLHSRNTQLRRHVRILNQLKEKERAERKQNMETLCNAEVLILQEELTTAQAQLQELLDNLTELEKVLQDTQSQLRDREAENALIKTDLEATRSWLLDSEREKSELASLTQQRLKEIGKLNRIFQSRDSSNCPAVVESSVSDSVGTKQHGNTNRVTQHLMSLGQLEPTHTEYVCVMAENNGNTPTLVQLKNTSSHPDVRSDGKPAETSARCQNSHLNQSHCLDEVRSYGRQLEKERGQLLNYTLSQCDEESIWSDWSWRSGSTCSTRYEAAFRDGLAALDASIASLQKTIHLDLGR